MDPAIYNSFLVRLWRARPADHDWRGEIEHIQSGACWDFDSLEAVLRFLERATAERQAFPIGTHQHMEEHTMKIDMGHTTASRAQSSGGLDWESLGGSIDSAPAAIYIAQTQAFHVYGRGYGGTLLQYVNGTWQDLGAPPSGVTESPGASMRGGEVTHHVAVRGGDSHMYQRWFDGRRWSEWENRGGDLASGPALASWNAGRLDCFALGMFGNLIHSYWDVSFGWAPWEDLSPRLPFRYDIQFAPAAVSWGDNRIDVFAVRMGDNHMLHSYWDGQAWYGWEDMGGVLSASPVAISRGPGRLDVFARGSDAAIYHRGWNGQRWSDWLGFRGRPISSAPAAASAGEHIELYARGDDSALIWRNGSFVP
jgi:hypothetical protein